MFTDIIHKFLLKVLHVPTTTMIIIIIYLFQICKQNIQILFLSRLYVLCTKKKIICYARRLGIASIQRSMILIYNILQTFVALMFLN